MKESERMMPVDTGWERVRGYHQQMKGKVHALHL